MTKIKIFQIQDKKGDILKIDFRLHCPIKEKVGVQKQNYTQETVTLFKMTNGRHYENCIFIMVAVNHLAVFDIWHLAGVTAS